MLGLERAQIKIMRIFGWLYNVVGNVIPGFDLNQLRSIAAFSLLVEPNIFQDGKEPPLNVAVGAQLLHSLHGASVGFLH